MLVSLHTMKFFYGALLRLVPLVRAVSEGELPIELSMSGARLAEKAKDAGEEALERLEASEGTLSELVTEVVRRDQVQGELRELRRQVEALDLRDRAAVAEIDRKLLALAKVLDGAEGTG